MRKYSLILPILIWGFLFSDNAVPADLFAENSNRRWGITTKEPVEDEKDEKVEKERDFENNREELSSADNKPEREEKPKAGEKGKSDSEVFVSNIVRCHLSR